jgi:hypothetical protein
MEKHAKAGEKEISEVRSQVRRCFDFDDERQFAAPDRGQQLFAGLDRALRPAMLLGLEPVHVDRELRGRDDVGKENKLNIYVLMRKARLHLSMMITTSRYVLMP